VHVCNCNYNLRSKVRKKGLHIDATKKAGNAVFAAIPGVFFFNSQPA